MLHVVDDFTNVKMVIAKHHKHSSLNTIQEFLHKLQTVTSGLLILLYLRGKIYSFLSGTYTSQFTGVDKADYVIKT